MKKNVFLLLVCAVLMSSCKFGSITFGNGKRIEPSKNIVKKEYKHDAFDKIDVETVANVKIIQSKEGDHRVVLSAPENYVDLFLFEVKNHELTLKFKVENTNIEAKDVDVTVYVPTLRRLENSGVATVEMDRLTSDELEIDNSGVGSIYLSGLTVRRIDTDCSGVGSVELNGTADHAELECSGVGSIKAEGLKAKSVEAEVSGVGGIRCYASESIEGEVSGVGSLKYGGQPQKKKLKRDGVGDITEL